jgi:hypothetical protein
MDNANRLFTLRLVLDVKKGLQEGPIDYGRELFGMDKRRGSVTMQRRSEGSRVVKHVRCIEDGDTVLDVGVDDTADAILEIESGIEMTRELGLVAVMENLRQIRTGEELCGGMVSPDFRLGRDPARKLGRKETVEVQARYKFNPRLVPLGKEGLTIGTAAPPAGDKPGNLAWLLREMDFRAEIATVDPHLKSVLFLEGWPTPEGRAAPDRPPRFLPFRTPGA